MSAEWEPRWRDLAGRIEDAMRHYESAVSQAGARLYVDWEDIAHRMFVALLDDAPPLTEAERRHDAYQTERADWERDALSYGGEAA